jgi:hypothetical protein
MFQVPTFFYYITIQMFLQFTSQQKTLFLYEKNQMIFEFLFLPYTQKVYLIFENPSLYITNNGQDKNQNYKVCNSSFGDELMTDE